MKLLLIIAPIATILAYIVIKLMKKKRSSGCGMVELEEVVAEYARMVKIQPIFSLPIVHKGRPK